MAYSAPLFSLALSLNAMQADDEHVTVWEPATGKTVAGNAAPYRRNLSQWLALHPGWEEKADELKSSKRRSAARRAKTAAAAFAQLCSHHTLAEFMLSEMEDRLNKTSPGVVRHVRASYLSTNTPQQDEDEEDEGESSDEDTDPASKKFMNSERKSVDMGRVTALVDSEKKQLNAIFAAENEPEWTTEEYVRLEEALIRLGDDVLMERGETAFRPIHELKWAAVTMTVGNQKVERDVLVRAFVMMSRAFVHASHNRDSADSALDSLSFCAGGGAFASRGPVSAAVAINSAGRNVEGTLLADDEDDLASSSFGSTRYGNDGSLTSGLSFQSNIASRFNPFMMPGGPESLAFPGHSMPQSSVSFMERTFRAPREPRITVWEPSTGRTVSGNAAPCRRNLDQWIAAHPGWEPKGEEHLSSSRRARNRRARSNASSLSTTPAFSSSYLQPPQQPAMIPVAASMPMMVPKSMGNLQQQQAQPSENLTPALTAALEGLLLMQNSPTVSAQKPPSELSLRDDTFSLDKGASLSSSLKAKPMARAGSLLGVTSIVSGDPSIRMSSADTAVPPALPLPTLGKTMTMAVPVPLVNNDNARAAMDSSSVSESANSTCESEEHSRARAANDDDVDMDMGMDVVASSKRSKGKFDTDLGCDASQLMVQTGADDDDDDLDEED